MQGLLDDVRLGKVDWTGPRALKAYAAIGMLLGIFYVAVHSMHLGTVLAAHPALTMPILSLFPILGASFIALLMPLLVYLVHQQDFGTVNILSPAGYAYVARKTFTAFKTNNWKISGKEL